MRTAKGAEESVRRGVSDVELDLLVEGVRSTTVRRIQFAAGGRWRGGERRSIRNFLDLPFRLDAECLAVLASLWRHRKSPRGNALSPPGGIPKKTSSRRVNGRIQEIQRTEDSLTSVRYRSHSIGASAGRPFRGLERLWSQP